jgi:hypothetical protein
MKDRTMRTKRFSITAAALSVLTVVTVLAIASCAPEKEPPLGELMLLLNTDMRTPQDLDGLSLTIEAEGEDQPIFQRDYTLPSDEMRLPATFAVIQGSQAQRRVHFIVKGRLGTTERVTREVRTLVPPSGITAVPLFLQWRCADKRVVCGPGLTCENGACAPIDKELASLPPYTEGDEANLPADGAPIPGADGGADGSKDGATGDASLDGNTGDASPGCGDTQSTAQNCGACGHDCNALPHTTGTGATCVTGKCVVPASSCEKGFLHCTTNVEQGCETDITAPANCGECNHACATSEPQCAPSGATYACTSGCPTGTSLCSNACVDLNTSVQHCGTCPVQCSAPPGGTSKCASGSCDFTCNTNYHRCGATCARDDDATLCGASCTPCQAPTGGHAVCTANKCDIACDGVTTKCGSSCINVANDPANCGACGHDCGAGATCDRGTCLPAVVWDRVNALGMDVGAAGVLFTADAALYQCPALGCTVAPTVLGSNFNSTGYLAVGGGYAVLVGAPHLPNANIGLAACPVGGCPPTIPFIVPTSRLTNVGNQFTVGADIYYESSLFQGSTTTWTFHRCAGWNGSTCATFDITFAKDVTHTEGGGAVTADANNAYFLAPSGTSSNLVSCPNGGASCTPTVLATSVSPTRLAAYGGRVFMMNKGFNGPITVCPAAGCTTTGPATFTTLAGPPTDIAIDASGVYWIMPSGSIQMCPVGGCGSGPRTIATGLTRPSNLRLHGSSVYWLQQPEVTNVTTPNSGAVWRVAKP